MLRIWLCITTGLLFASASLIAGAHWIGHHHVVTPGLDGFTAACKGRSIPCWNGIVPGETTFGEAATRLRSLGYQVLLDDRYYLDTYDLHGYSPVPTECDVFARVSLPAVDDPVIEAFTLMDCPPLLVGDVLLRLGEPSQVGMCNAVALPVYTYDRHLTVTSEMSSQGDWISPHQRVKRITLIHRFDRPQQTSWYGFIPLWRYQQLADTVSLCLPI
jgi:hypothetical protein